MYLSHAVRTVRDDPMVDESVGLVVTLTDDPGEPVTAEAFDAEISALEGEVVAALQFSAVHVRLPETAVADLCALDGIERIETAETLRLVGDEAAETDGVDKGDDAVADHERRPGSGT